MPPHTPIPTDSASRESQLASRRAHRRANRVVALAVRGAEQQQVSDVDAADHQQKRDRSDYERDDLRRASVEIAEELLAQRDRAIGPSAPLGILGGERAGDRRNLFVGTSQGRAGPQARDRRVGGGQPVLNRQRLEHHLQGQPDLGGEGQIETCRQHADDGGRPAVDDQGPPDNVGLAGEMAHPE
jgi:hypothetical protein